MKKPTIKDVAQAAGVSTSMVSFVMNNARGAEKKYTVNQDTAQRIMKVAEELGYRPSKAASSLRSGGFNAIGVLLPDIANYYFCEMARIIENIAYRNGYMVFFASMDEELSKMEKALDSFLDNDIKGLIAVPCEGSDAMLERLVKSHLPTVLIDRDLPGEAFGRVQMDNVSAARQSIRHLINKGCRKIEMLSYDNSVSCISERELGYCDAMKTAGLESEIRINHINIARRSDEISRIVREARSRGADALMFSTNSISELGLMELNRLGCTDLGLVCFDIDRITAFYNPHVNTVTQPVREMAEESFNMLCDMMNGGAPRKIILDPHFNFDFSTSLPYTKSDSVLLPASMFANYGGWILDSQYIDNMGSSVLLAHGLGRPVEDAVTEFEVPETAKYNVFVRTRNWTAKWSKASAPGSFKIALDGCEIDNIFGAGSFDWDWERGGAVSLTKGHHRLAIHDLFGFEARVDAILLTRSQVTPPSDARSISFLREQLLGISPMPRTLGEYDFVVVGGGVAGMCAAISAARLGQKVALVQDRKVLGGNNSSEVRVGLGGRLNIGRYPSLGYLLNEFAPVTKGNARPRDVYEDERKMQAILAEENITLLTGYRVQDVVKKTDDTISAVVAVDTVTYERVIIRGKLFCDSTGDACLGRLAGAEVHMGREARSEFGEPSAPEHADEMTMGASVQWYAEHKEHDVDFPDIDWGLGIDERSVQVVTRGQWYWEVGMRDDQVRDAECIRDWGMYVAYSNWAYLKKTRPEYAKASLEWLSFIAGKRESYRIMGEFVLREQDLLNFTEYPDGCVSTSWYIDHHKPNDENSKLFPGREWISDGCLQPLDFYPIPYRCFYSKDISNLFMAGRDISVTHQALGTTRVMRTCAMIGEVVGMAASLCGQHKALPRQIYSEYFHELVALMKKGVGRTDLPYTQIYTLIDTTAVKSENC